MSFETVVRAVDFWLSRSHPERFIAVVIVLVVVVVVALCVKCLCVVQ